MFIVLHQRIFIKTVIYDFYRVRSILEKTYLGIFSLGENVPWELGTFSPGYVFSSIPSKDGVLFRFAVWPAGLLYPGPTFTFCKLFTEYDVIPTTYKTYFETYHTNYKDNISNYPINNITLYINWQNRKIGRKYRTTFTPTRCACVHGTKMKKKGSLLGWQVKCFTLF